MGFLESKSDASEFVRTLLNQMGKYEVEESTSTIDEYARSTGGAARRTMRFACLVPPEVKEELHESAAGGTCPSLGEAEEDRGTERRACVRRNSARNRSTGYTFEPWCDTDTFIRPE